MSARILRAADTPAVPWKNGQGRTRPLAIYPPNAGMDDFLWRISVAEVDSAAPFSRFPGVDRWIALLHGPGFVMRLDRTRTHRLERRFETFAFSGDAMVDVELIGGATRDFNVMTRRSRATAHIDIWHEPGDYLTRPEFALLYCAEGSAVCTDGSLHAGDSWLRPPANSIATIIDTQATLLAVSISLF